MRVRSLGRRGFITVLGGAAAWPLAGYAQQPERMRRVGVLIHWPEDFPPARASVAALGKALADFGWVEGKNIRIDYRFAAGGNPTLFKTYAAELVGMSPDAILASTTPGLAAVREQTRTIPIVFVNVSDPLDQGIVESLARPGGNITGFTDADAPVLGKWLQLLKDVAPSVTRVAVIFNPGNPALDLYNRAIEAAAPSLGMTVTLAPVHDDAGIEEAIAAQAREPNGGLIAYPQAFNATHGGAIIAAAARHRLPLMSGAAITRAGGLMSYWIDSVALFAQPASYIDRILRGASPADLPVQQPTKYSLVINLKTAKALGLTVPAGMLDLADEVIE
jgi:putative ABC transport system substrate-binding protein